MEKGSVVQFQILKGINPFKCGYLKVGYISPLFPAKLIESNPEYWECIAIPERSFREKEVEYIAGFINNYLDGVQYQEHGDPSVIDAVYNGIRDYLSERGTVELADKIIASVEEKLMELPSDWGDEVEYTDVSQAVHYGVHEFFKTDKLYTTEK